MERGVAQQLQKSGDPESQQRKVVNTNTSAFLLSRARRITSCLSIRRSVKGCWKRRCAAGKQRLAGDEALIYVESEVENGLPPVPMNWHCIVKKWPDRSPTVSINVRPKEKTMLINFGRLLMLCVWAFLLLNLFQPFPKPLNIFVNVALIFMILMHGLQLTLLKATQPKEMPPLGRFEQIRIFIFGVFELVAWQKKLKATLKKK
jgi:putative membrane protein